MTIKITELALKQMLAAYEAEGLGNDFFIRISVAGGGCSGYQHKLDFDNELDETDVVEEYPIDGQKIKVVVDEFSILYLENVELDYETSELESGFKFNGGAIKKHCACGSSVAY